MTQKILLLLSTFTLGVFFGTQLAEATLIKWGYWRDRVCVWIAIAVEVEIIQLWHRQVW